jgi:hypothetical protein
VYVSYNVNRHNVKFFENKHHFHFLINLSADKKGEIEEIIRKQYFSGVIGHIRLFLYRIFNRRFEIRVDLDRMYEQKGFKGRLKSVLKKCFNAHVVSSDQTNHSLNLVFGAKCLQFKDEAQNMIEKQLSGFDIKTTNKDLCARLSKHVSGKSHADVSGYFIRSRFDLDNLPTCVYDYLDKGPRNSKLSVFVKCMVDFFDNYDHFKNLTWHFEGCEISHELVKSSFLHLLMHFVSNYRAAGTPTDKKERRDYYESIVTYLSGAYVSVLGSNKKPDQLSQDIVERILMPMTAHLNKGCGSRWNEEAIGIYRAQLLSTDHSSISMSDMVFSELTQLREHIFRTEMIPHLKYEMLHFFIIQESSMQRAESDYVDCFRRHSLTVNDPDISKAINALKCSEYMTLQGPGNGNIKWRKSAVDQLFYKDEYDIHYQNAMISHIADEYGLKKTQNDPYVNHPLLRHFVLDENKQYMNKRLQDVFFSKYYTPDAMVNVLIHSTKFKLNDLFDELVPLENLANIEPLEVNDDDSNDQNRIKLSKENLQQQYNVFEESCKSFNKSSDNIIYLSKIKNLFHKKTQESDGEALRYIMKKDSPLAGQYMKLINIRNGLQAQRYTDNVIMSEAEQARRQELAIRAAAKQKGEKWVAMKILKEVGVLIEHISISDA